MFLGLDLDVMGRGLSSSGDNDDMEDPVDDPLTCLDNPDTVLLVSVIFIRDMSSCSEETLALLEAWGKRKKHLV